MDAAERYVKRILDISAPLRRKSQFLFGPRMTGKSTLIEKELVEKPALYWNLLRTGLQMRVKQNPELLTQEVEARQLSHCLIVIDEIQLVPELLDEIHFLIEERSIRFLLSGSSSRKLLREKGPNLLGGRAGNLSLHPFVYPEIKEMGVTLEHIFTTGLMPHVLLSDDPDQDLDDYIAVYLRDEIGRGGNVRKLETFARFLDVAALTNAEQVNYMNRAGDVGISRQSIANWYQILIDTLIGHYLPAYTKGVKRKTFSLPKFYLFDLGITRALLQIPPPVEGQSEYGRFLEHYIFMELKAYLDYGRRKEILSYWRTTGGIEVDFILGDRIAIKVKATKQSNARDYKGLLAFMEEGIAERHILVCREEHPRNLKNGVEIHPWTYFLEQLWGGKIL